jgi:hypothetical protein
MTMVNYNLVSKKAIELARICKFYRDLRLHTAKVHLYESGGVEVVHVVENKLA